MLQIALIGAGDRGMFAYGPYALKRPNEVQFIAIAEPDEERRKRFAEAHHIPMENQFSSWQEMLDRPKLCEAIMICTQDREHYGPTMKAIDRGYHIMLEKPMSPNPLEALRMAEAAEEKGCVLTVCHTMRYSPYFLELKKIVESKVIGRMMNIQWTESVGYWHQAHSFVRGNWRNSEESSPMLLQKCCHDMDMMQWLVGEPCEQVSSFGMLSHFKKEHAPAGSTERCTDGCAVEHECPYSAIKWYYNERDDWPQSVVSLEPSLKARWEALKTGPYGRCVYHCDNDVVDHQVVNLKFGQDITVAFTMNAFSMDNTRSFRISGTEGEIRGYQDKNEIVISRFGGEEQRVYPRQVEGRHHGADTLIMQEFIAQVKSGDVKSKTSGTVSAMNHLIVFAAEESRRTERLVKMSEYVQQLKY